MNTINNLILNYLRKNKITEVSLARKINYSDSGIYKLLRNSLISSDTLYKISTALNHDFYHEFYSQIPGTQSENELHTIETNRLKQEIIHLKEENNWLKKENEYLNLINSLLTPKQSP